MRSATTLPRLLRNAPRAAAELARARIALRRIKPADIIARNRKAAALAASDAAAEQCSEVAFFINRMAARVPWRADCLVQALAGQRWLARSGIASEIVIGTARRPDGALASHAWLRHNGRVVLGGDIGSYLPLFGTDTDGAG